MTENLFFLLLQGEIFLNANVSLDRELMTTKNIRVLAKDSPNDASVRKTATAQVNLIFFNKKNYGTGKRK